ncbi:MAG: PilZ domain-containing protein [Endomicrobiia bacterium]
MTNKKESSQQFQERRKYLRLPILKDIAKPVDLFFNSSSVPIPAILLDLSACGMGLLTFVPVQLGTKITANLTLPELNIKNIEGKVVWTLTKENSWRIGIVFTKIDKSEFDKIKKMSDDHSECENRISSGITDVCTTKCSYFPLCSKSVKLK